MRAKHSETIQKLKAQFLQEKKLFQDQSDTRIQAMAKQANQASSIQCVLEKCPFDKIRHKITFKIKLKNDEKRD